jgi:hypothetical protein
MRAFRRLYGRRGPGHLLAMLLTYAITGYAVWAIFQNPEPWTVLLWLGLAIAAHDFVFLPLYTAAYWLVRRVGDAADQDRRRRVIALQHVAVPVMVSVLLLLAALPLIFSLSSDLYRPTTGMTEEPYLERWLVFTGALFVLSGIAYAIRVRSTARS